MATEPVGVFAEGPAVCVVCGVFRLVACPVEEFSVVDAGGGAGLVGAAPEADRSGAHVVRVLAGLAVEGEGVGALQGVSADALAGEGDEGWRVGVVAMGVLPVEVEAFPFGAGVTLEGQLEEDEHDDAEGVDVEAGAGVFVGGLVSVGADFLSDFWGAEVVAEGGIDSFELADGFVGDFVAHAEVCYF